MSHNTFHAKEKISIKHSATVTSSLRHRSTYIITYSDPTQRIHIQSILLPKQKRAEKLKPSHIKEPKSLFDTVRAKN